jgi:hypothetical protein
MGWDGTRWGERLPSDRRYDARIASHRIASPWGAGSSYTWVLGLGTWVGTGDWERTLLLPRLASPRLAPPCLYLPTLPSPATNRRGNTEVGRTSEQRTRADRPALRYRVVVCGYVARQAAS